jgi:hypothetical protein
VQEDEEREQEARDREQDLQHDGEYRHDVPFVSVSHPSIPVARSALRTRTGCVHSTRRDGPDPSRLVRSF